MLTLELLVGQVEHLLNKITVFMLHIMLTEILMEIGIIVELQQYLLLGYLEVLEVVEIRVFLLIILIM